MPISLTGKLVPQNNAFIGLVDARQVSGGTGGGTLPPETIPYATTGLTGGIIVGSGLTITSGGILSVSGETLNGSYLPLSGGVLTGSVTGVSFVTSGGTSSKFVKGDGSLDSNGYLNLTGGTLTGKLNSTITDTEINSVNSYRLFSGDISRVSGNTSTVTEGIYQNVSYSGTTNISGLYGINLFTRNLNNATISNLYGIQSYARNDASGKTTNMVGGYFSVRNNTTGSFNKMLGIQSSLTNNSGDITNNDVYGISSSMTNGVSGFTDSLGGLTSYIYNYNIVNEMLGVGIYFPNIGTVNNSICGLKIGSDIHPWVGTTTNMYGIYIHNTVNNGTTDNYALYSDTLAYTYFKGNVGIGTITPYTKLHISGNTMMGTGDQTSILGNATLQIQTETNVESVIGLWQNGISSILIGSKSNDTNAYITNNYYDGGIGNSGHSITLTPNGNIGFGTSTPSNALDIVGDTDRKIYLYTKNSTGNSTVQYLNDSMNYEVGIFSNDYGINSGVNRVFTIYTDGTAKFNYSLTGVSFVTSGGTSSDFVKGDGSLDTNTYTTVSSFTGHTSNMSNPHNTTALQIGAEPTISTSNSNLVYHGDKNFSAVVESDIVLSSSNSTNNATSTKHGFLPQLSDNVSQFLNGQGNWSIPAGTANSYTLTYFNTVTGITVTHGFGTYPVVSVIDGSGDVILPLSIKHTINEFVVKFTSPTTGNIITSVGSPQHSAVLITSNNYIAVVNDKHIKVTSSNKIVTLLSAVNISGFELYIDNASNGNITVNTTGIETIHGELIQLVPSNSTLAVYSDGTNWRIF